MKLHFEKLRKVYIRVSNPEEGILEPFLSFLSFSLLFFPLLSSHFLTPRNSFTSLLFDTVQARSGHPIMPTRHSDQAHPTPSLDLPNKYVEWHEIAPNPRANRTSSQRQLLPLSRVPSLHHFRTNRTFLMARRPGREPRVPRQLAPT